MPELDHRAFPGLPANWPFDRHWPMAAESEETCPNFGFQTSPSRRTEIKVVMRLPSRRFQAGAMAHASSG